jgi:hypothetical protein
VILELILIKNSNAARVILEGKTIFSKLRLKDGGFFFIGYENDLVNISDIACRNILSLRVIIHKKKFKIYSVLI